MLKEKAIKGVKWTSLVAASGTLLQFLQIIVLTRFLNAHDFGLMAIVYVAIGFSQIFLDMGVSNAIIHKQDITSNELSSLFWFNIFIGILLFTFLVSISSFLGTMYDQPELPGIIRIISLSFLILPFEQQFYALMKKELRFDDIARREIISKLASFVIAIGLAILGYGVYALVIAYLGGVLIGVTLVMIFGLKFHKPSFHFSLREIKPYVSFGLYQMGDSIMNYFNAQFDTLLIGRLWGIETLGIYNVAKNIAMRPTQFITPVITQVSFPVMAKSQNDSQLLKRIYLKTINYLSSVNFPIYIFMAVMSQPLVLLLFGKNWIAAAPVLFVLALYVMFRSAFSPLGSIILAKGKIKISFYWNLSLLIITPLIIYIGSFRGLIGISYAQLVLMILLMIPAWKIVFLIVGIGFMEYFKEIVIPLAIAAGLFLILPITSIWEILPLIQLSIAGAIMIVYVLIVNRYFNNSFYADIIFYGKQIITRFKGTR